MDDLELEARLRTRLHVRFDDATPAPQLVSKVNQALTTAARPVGLATRTGRLRLGWAAVAAVVVIAVAAIGIGKGFGPTGPGAAATPSPYVPAATDRMFILVPANGALVGKSEGTLADEVLSTRLRALGVGTFASAGGDLMTFWVPVGGPSDASIRAVLSAIGDVRVVPLPAADYGAGMRVATLGESLPKDEPALFGWDGIASFTTVALNTFEGNVQGPWGLGMILKPAAAQAFAEYVAAHAGETYAIVVDGKVALLPTAQPASGDGSFSLSNGQLPGGSKPTEAYDETVAVLVGGILPEAWRGATSPVLITQATAEGAALAATNGGTVHSASLGAGLTYSLPRGDYWQIAWRIEVVQPDCPDVSACVSPGWSTLVEVDAVTGAVFHVGALEP